MVRMSSSPIFPRTASKGSLDNKGVKTPTRIVFLSPPTSPVILSQVAYVTFSDLWSCGHVGGTVVRKSLFGGIHLRQVQCWLCLIFLSSIAGFHLAAQAPAAVDSTMPA